MEDKNLPIQHDISIADDFLLQVAEHAERRIDAVMKIKRVALKVTNPRDWTDQNGNPYLQVSGSEKIANLFNISWRIEEPIYDEESDGHFTWTYKGVFSLGGRTIEAIGTRSSKDAFFNKYEYGEKDPNGKSSRTLLPPSAIDKGDVKKAAMTNLLGNGITRILGIRNLQWEDIKEFAGVTREQVTSVQYKKGGEKPPIEMPQEKSNGTTEATPPIVVAVDSVEIKTGKKGDGKPWTLYLINAGGEKYSTFSKTFADIARKSFEEKSNCIIHFTETEKGRNMDLILTPEHEYFLKDKKLDGLTSTIKEAGLIRDGDPWYMTRGTALHLATEFYDKKTLNESTVHPEIMGYLQSWKVFRQDQNYTPIEIEYLTYHPELMVGTKIDRLPLLDIKSGSPEPWHILQIAFQWACLRVQKFDGFVGWEMGMWRTPMDVYLDKDGRSPKVKVYTQSELREAFKVYASMLVFLRWRREKGI